MEQEIAEKELEQRKMKVGVILGDLTEIMELLTPGAAREYLMADDEEREQLYKRLDRCIISVAEMLSQRFDNSIVNYVRDKRDELVNSSWKIDVAEHYRRPVVEGKEEQLQIMWEIARETNDIVKSYEQYSANPSSHHRVQTVVRVSEMEPGSLMFYNFKY